MTQIKTLYCADCRLERPRDEMKPRIRQGYPVWVCKECPANG